MTSRERFLASALVCSVLSIALLLGGWVSHSHSAAPTPAKIIEAADFPSLQAALDAVPEAGGLVKLPPGDFELTQPLRLQRENTRILGSGASTHLINRNQEGAPALILRHPNRDNDPKARLWRVQLADFRISGNPKSGDGLLAEGMNEIYIHGLSVDHNGGHGMNLIDCYEDPRVSDSIITYNGKAGINIVKGHDIAVSANQLEENLDGVRCLDGYNLNFTGNVLDDHLRHGVVIENTYGSVLSGNMIEECVGTAIILDRDCYGITVSANVIAHNLKGVDLRDAWGCAVSANTFTIIPGQALRIGPQSGRITVTGNNFSNSHIGDRTRRKENYEAEWPALIHATGILLEGTSDVAITGNIFTGLIHEAIKAVGQPQRIVVVGNVSSDLGRLDSKRSEPYALDTAQNVVGLNAQR